MTDTPARMGIEGEGMKLQRFFKPSVDMPMEADDMGDYVYADEALAEIARLTAANIELTERALYAEREHNFPAGFAWCGKHGYFSAAVEDTDCPACAAESEAAALRAELARRDKALEWLHRKFHRACPRGWMAEVYDKINEALFNGDLGKEMAVVQSYEKEALREAP